MSAFAFHAPTRIELGAGKSAELARFVPGEHVVLLTYPSARASGLAARVAAGLGRREVRTFAVGEMPDARALEALHREVWSAPVDALVGVGGGSVLDATKALALRAVDGAPHVTGFAAARALLRGEEPAERFTAAPIVAVPTTAGTGSEVTPWATVWDRDAQEKRSLEHRALFPTVAVCDPTLTLGLSPRTTVSSALDALSHALEALWSRAANPVSSALAMDAARGVVEHLPRVVAEPARADAREGLMVAALEAGLAFSSTRTGAAHALSYAATLRRGVPHGLACALFLAPVLDVLAEQGDPLVPALGALFGARPGDGVRAFLRAVDVSPRAADHALSPEDFAALARTLRTSARGKNSRVDSDALLARVARELRGEAP